ITGPSRCVPACGRQRCGSEHAVTDTPQISNVFIRRPIFSGVISIVIVLLGLFALRTLPVNSYPALTPPEIQVQAVYPGATAQDVAAAVAADRAAALRTRRLALLQVVELERRRHEPVGLLRHLEEPRPRRGGRAEPDRPRRAAAPPGGRAQRDHGTEAPDEHPRGWRAHRGRP